MRRMKIVYPFLFSILLIFSCAREVPSTLTIATAANMQYFMEDLTYMFMEDTGIDCFLNVSSSGKLNAQIQQGAPFDVFVSADMAYPLDLYEKGFTTAAPQVYAYGKLVMWSNRLGIIPSPSLLNSGEIKKIAIANPKIAPYGRAAEQVLVAYGLQDSLIAADKIVYGESIAQVNQFISSGAADLGFTAKSAVLSEQLAGQGSWIEVDDRLYEPIAQGVVLVKREEMHPYAKAFYDFLFSDTGRSLLQAYGYLIE